MSTKTQVPRQTPIQQTTYAATTTKKQQTVPKILECSEIDIVNNFTHTPIKFDSKFAQGNGFPNFRIPGTTKTDKATFRTGEIFFGEGGIPRFNLKATFPIAKDEDREFFRIHYDKDNKAACDLFAMLEQIDKLLDTKEKRIELFGAERAQYYEYTPIISDPSKIPVLPPKPGEKVVEKKSLV